MAVNNCFFCCSSDLNSGSGSCGGGQGGGDSGDLGGANENRKEASIKLILNYLLGCYNNGELNLTEDILSLWRRGLGQGEGQGCGGGVVNFCGKCNHLVGHVSELHLQLEGIQMKIINSVESLRSLVIQNCSKQVNEKEDNIGGRQLEETLSSFQRAVSNEANKLKAVKVPFVLLEKCFKSAPGAPAHPTFLIVNNDASDAISEKVRVKTEPEEPEVDSLPLSPDYHDDCDEDLQQEHLPVKQDLQEPEDNQEWRPPVEKRSNKSRKLRKKALSPPKRLMPKRQKSKNLSNDDALEERLQIKSKVTKKSKPKKKRIKRQYSCDTCSSDSGFTTKSLHKFHSHLQSHETSEPTYKCLNCPTPTLLSGQQLYNFHVDCHQGMFQLTCDLCTKRVDHFYLKSHMVSCFGSGAFHSSDGKLFPCPNCCYCTSSRSKYLDHLLKDHGQSGILMCDICNLEVSTRRKLLQHLFDVHEAIEKLKCGHPNCDKSYLDPQQLYVHEQEHKRQFECPDCHKLFGNPQVLKIHSRHHTGERPHICPECGQGHITKPDLQRHQINSHGAPKSQCHFCEKSYTDNRSLLHHLTTHTGDPTFSCDKCGKNFMTQAHLERHLPRHSDQLNFVCDSCGKAFRTKDSLASHKRTHKTLKPFKCDICSKAFKVIQHLVAHMRTHTGERPFACDICGARFTQAGPLNKHKNTMHKG